MYWLRSPSVSALGQTGFDWEQRGMFSEDLWKATNLAKFVNKKNKIYRTAHNEL